MPVQILCPNPKCQRSLSLAEDLVGRGARCPHCGQAFRVGASRAGSAPRGTMDARVSTGGTAGPALEAPTAIDRYQVRRKLGEGAFGVVYHAFDSSMSRDVAIKLLKVTGADAAGGRSAGVVKRFQREAEVLAKLRHGNIVAVHDRGVFQGAPYLVSEFIEGPTLSKVIPENGFEAWRAVQLALQLLDALAYAHKRNVLHRDVKPANALLDAEGRLYLTDFGLAGLVGQEDARLTHDGTVLGTPSYMSPEQANGDTARIGPAADQYSAGVVLYELLTGRLPFEGGPLPALLYNVVHTPPPPLREYRADLPPELESICLLSLAKEPEERFGSCLEFADALRGWSAGHDPRSAASTPAPPRAKQPPTAGAHRSTLKGRSSAGTVSTPPPLVPKATARGVSRRAWLLAALAGVTVPLVAAGGYVAFKAMHKDDGKQKETKPKSWNNQKEEEH